MKKEKLTRDELDLKELNAYIELVEAKAFVLRILGLGIIIVVAKTIFDSVFDTLQRLL